MLLVKKYNEKTKAEDSWYKSSMIYHMKMVEDETENKGDLYVTFNNGTQYKYKGVTFEDYVVILGGGTDDSQGKTLNKLVKGRYEYEKCVTPANHMELLKEEYEKVCQEQSNKYKTVFVSYYEDLTEEETFIYLEAIANEINENPDIIFIIPVYSNNIYKKFENYINARNIDTCKAILYSTQEIAQDNVKMFSTMDEAYGDAIKNSYKDVAFVRSEEEITNVSKTILKRHKLLAI